MALFAKKPDIVISLGDDGAIISAFLEGQLIKRIFVTTPSSTDFMDLVKSYADSPIYLLLDTIDQNYIFSNVPAISRAGVNKVIERKITTEFDPNDINASLFLAKETGNKPTLRYLFVSVRNAPPLKDWLTEIYNLPNKFMGIYLLPIEAESFIKEVRTITHGELIPIPKEWEVFITYNRVGGFRQVVLRNGKLIFTRISQSVSLQTPDAIGKNISHEAANTLEYIRRIGFGDQTISIYIICSKDAGNYIEIPGVKSKDVYTYTPFELAQKMGFEQNAQESDKFGDVIFATSFINNQKKILKLLTPEIKARQKRQAIAKSVSYTSYFMFVVMPLVAAFFLYQGFSSLKQVGANSKILEEKQNQFNALKDFKQVYGISPEMLDDVMKTRDAFNEKDKFLFDILSTYRQLDQYSTSITDIGYEEGSVPGAFELKIVSKFIFPAGQSFSDVLYAFDQFSSKMKDAFKQQYDVNFEGLPSDKDLKVDVQSGEQKGSSYDVTVIITNKQQ